MRKIQLFVLLLLLACGAFGISAQTGVVPGADRYVKKTDTAAGTCTAAKKGYVYFSTTTNTVKSCDGTTWSTAGGSSGITVGTTTSNGTANALLKTNGSSQVVSSNVTDDGTLVTSSLPVAAPATFSTSNPGFTFAGFPSAGFTQSGGTSLFAIGSGRAIALDNGNLQVLVGSGYQYSWSSGNVGAAGQDTGIKRVAATVIAASDGSSGLGWVQTSGVKRVATNVTNATATMTNITDLSITVQAGRKYSGTYSFVATNSTAAEGIQFDFNGGSATVTSIQFMFVTAPPGVTLGTTQSAAIATAITATTATTTNVVYTVYFDVVINAAGTLIPRVAEVSHTSGTATVKAGSSSDINDLP